MATAIIMPKVDMDQETGTVVEWIKGEGEEVKQGEPILVVETAKVAFEVEAPASGILGGITAGPGEVIPIATIIAYILEPGEAPPAGPAKGPGEPVLEQAAPQASPGQQSQTPSATPLARRLARETGVDPARIAGTGPGGRVTKTDVQSALTADRGAEVVSGKAYATPAARRMASARGIDLHAVRGSGPAHRIQVGDVAAAAVSAPLPASTGLGAVTTIPLQGMRRAVAERMTRSVREAPQFALMIEVDMRRAEAMRLAFNRGEGAKITHTAIVLKACAWALTKHRLANACLAGEEIHLLSEVNIGVAVALEEGLIVPVVHDADQKGIAEIAQEIADLSLHARDGRLTARDLTGGTFTVSNLGMFGIDQFTAIINPPESAILAVGRVANRAGEIEDGKIGLIPTMSLTLTVDHRVLDGATAARFLHDIGLAIEEPGWLSY